MCIILHIKKVERELQVGYILEKRHHARSNPLLYFPNLPANISETVEEVAA